MVTSESQNSEYLGVEGVSKFLGSEILAHHMVSLEVLVLWGWNLVFRDILGENFDSHIGISKLSIFGVEWGLQIFEERNFGTPLYLMKY